MPRKIRPTKDVAGCEKPRGATKQALIRGYPNGETYYSKPVVTQWCNSIANREPTELKHLSKSRNRKQIAIPGVVASETGTALFASDHTLLVEQSGKTGQRR